MDAFEGKVAVVTGAASGIGAALARAFAAEGMRVVVADVDEPGAERVAAELRGRGAEATAVRVDVANADQVDELATATLERYGAVHLVCNNAGVGGGGPMTELDPAEWSHVLGVNLWGVIHGVRAFLPHLLAQDEGHVVNTASVAGLFAAPFMGPYSVSKFGVVALSETLFHELALAGSRVGVSVLCPSWVRTGIAAAVRRRRGAMPAGEGGTDMLSVLDAVIEAGMDPDEVAAQVVAAVRDGAFYVLTHPSTDPAVRRRMEAILARERPPFVMPE